MTKLWSPFVIEGDGVFVCISPLVAHDSAPSGLEIIRDMHLRDNNRVALRDAVSMSRIVSFLSSIGVAVQIWDSYELTIDQFNRAPVVLIGALNKKWPSRFTASLRFRFNFVPQSQTVSVFDQETPGVSIGSISMHSHFVELEQDFAIITRLIDPSIGKPLWPWAALPFWGLQQPRSSS